MSFYENTIFPILLDTLTIGLRQQRQEVMQAASGRVLEIGIGTGANLPFYTDQATAIVGIEPSTALLDRARARVQQLPPTRQAAVVLQPGSAEHLDFADANFDTVVACLVFCTIPQAETAAREMYRVLKPGGRVVFFEHVRASTATLTKWQDRLNELWGKFACGCHINRDTKSLFASVGFQYQELREYHHPAFRFLKLCAPVIQGVAVK
ncbi:MAG: class I SAM-dependent methyltransferase [Deltaproteobacteria bacterium]|nr:class I SAM-dependent methyltransferase [Deltaproteobacteria bacterium]